MHLVYDLPKVDKAAPPHEQLAYYRRLRGLSKDELADSLLFRVYQGGDLYSIPLQYVTWVEPLAGKPAAVLRSPDYIIGVYPIHGRNIRIVDMGRLLGLERTSDGRPAHHSLLIIENTEIGFLVESVLGVETLHSRQNSGSFAKQLIQSVYSCDGRDELVLELDMPRLLSLC